MRIIFTSLSIILSFLLVSCTTATIPEAELESVTLKLVWQPGIQFLGFYSAINQGYYAEENLAITIEHLNDMSEVATIADGVADGTFDFAISGTLLAEGQANGLSLTALAIISQFSPATFFARADSGINTPADFAGHSVVVKANSWGELLEQLLSNGDLTLDDIEAIDGGFDMTPFYEGEVDIWAGFINDEVVRVRQEGIDLVTFPLYEYGVVAGSEAIFSSQTLLETRPELVERFIRATLRGWNRAIENPEQAVDAMLEQFPELADEREFHIESFNAYIPLVRQPGITVGTIDCERWLSNEAFVGLDSTEGLCTTNVFEQAIQEN